MPSKPVPIHASGSTTTGEVWAIVPASGSGNRFSKQQDKLLYEIGGVPVLIRTLQSLLALEELVGIVLVSSKANQAIYQALIQQHLALQPDDSQAITRIHHALGGETRRASVYNGLIALPESATIALIHDAARPLLSPGIANQAIQAVESQPQKPESESDAIKPVLGAIVALPLHDTIKQVDPHSQAIQTTLDRNTLWRAQTPQVFDKAQLIKAHQQIPQEVAVTDDAQLMELAGFGPIVIIPGEESNIKITVPADARLAEALLQNQSASSLAAPLL